VKEIKKVVLIVNLLKTNAARLKEEIISFLEARGVACEVYSYEGEPLTPRVDAADLCISLGGDGTVLFAARHLSPLGIPIMAVNLGDFGFITEISQNEWRDAYLKFEVGALGLGERLMLSVEVVRNSQQIASFYGLNDTVISTEGISKLVKLRVDLKQAYLGLYRADGIIVSTPTGSTAYSAAAGGPLLSPEIEAMIINPICPFTLSNRPIVVEGDEEIKITVEKNQRAGVILTIDGQTTLPLLPGDEIIYRSAPFKVRLLRSDKRNFYEVIRTKLKWSGGPDD
jgi:NAD+ kinase